MKRLLLLFALLFVGADAGAQVTLVTLADVAGDGANHAVGTGTARWVLFVAPDTNAGTVRVGDSNISATRGTPIAAGGGFLYPPLPASSAVLAKDLFYDLSTLYYRVAVGDKVSVKYIR